MQNYEGTWKVVVPAPEVVNTHITVLPKQTFKLISLTGRTKGHPCNYFTNPPEGSMPTNEVNNFAPSENILPSARVGEALIRFGPGAFLPLGGKESSVMSSDQNAPAQIIFGFNFLKQYYYKATGSVTIVFGLQ